jgi:CubicO group peptidase (beta-lactamase class C family)
VWSFVRMIVAGGTSSGGERIVTAASVAQMTTDHLSPEQRASSTTFLGGGGWGYGMRAPDAATRGHAAALADGFGWDGGTGTMWRTSPVTGRTGILLTQRCMTSPEPPPVFRDFAAAADALFDGLPRLTP